MSTEPSVPPTDLRYIVTAVDARRAGVEYLQRHVPALEVVWDTEKRPPHSAMATFLRSLAMVRDDEAVVHFEDDICLTTDFLRKSEAVIADHKDSAVQFFSRSGKDAKDGSRWLSRFNCNPCVYFPRGMSRRIAAFYNSPEWDAERAIHPSGMDTLVGKFLTVNRIRHWVHVPSLVQHASEPSAIGTTGYGRDRSHYRQSKTFQDPELVGYPYSYPRR